MSRTKGSKNKGKRASARTAYETYSYWYDKYTKGEKAGWFREKYDKKEFQKQYELAKAAKLKNPARVVAMSQEYIDRKFERQYKQLYGTKLPDIRDKNKRKELFTNFAAEMVGLGMTYDEAREEFENYFY